jgi:hypothetical protein
LPQAASPPSDTHLYPTRERLDGDLSIRVVREADPELRVEVGLVLRISLSEDVDDVAQGLDQCSRLGLRELAVGNHATELCLGGLSLSLDIGDPLRNGGDCLAFVQERSRALEPPVTGSDLIAKRGFVFFGLGAEVIGAREDLAGVVEVLLVEQRGRAGADDLARPRPAADYSRNYSRSVPLAEPRSVSLMSWWVGEGWSAWEGGRGGAVSWSCWEGMERDCGRAGASGPGRRRRGIRSLPSIQLRAAPGRVGVLLTHRPPCSPRCACRLRDTRFRSR